MMKIFSQLLKNNSNLEIRNLSRKMIIDSYFQNSFEKMTMREIFRIRNFEADYTL